jgi:hypothetical protein
MIWQSRQTFEAPKNADIPREISADSIFGDWLSNPYVAGSSPARCALDLQSAAKTAHSARVSAFTHGTGRGEFHGSKAPQVQKDAANKLVREATGVWFPVFDKCQSCLKSKKPVVGHHPDYDRSNEVQWVCRSCHNLIHRKLRPTDLPVFIVRDYRNSPAKLKPAIAALYVPTAIASGLSLSPATPIATGPMTTAAPATPCPASIKPRRAGQRFLNQPSAVCDPNMRDAGYGHHGSGSQRALSSACEGGGA